MIPEFKLRKHNRIPFNDATALWTVIYKTGWFWKPVSNFHWQLKSSAEQEMKYWLMMYTRIETRRLEDIALIHAGKPPWISEQKD